MMTMIKFENCDNNMFDHFQLQLADTNEDGSIDIEEVKPLHCSSTVTVFFLTFVVAFLSSSV